MEVCVLARKDKLIRTTALVTAVIILSKVFGLARDVITAGYLSEVNREAAEEAKREAQAAAEAKTQESKTDAE